MTPGSGCYGCERDDEPCRRESSLCRSMIASILKCIYAFIVRCPVNPDATVHQYPELEVDRSVAWTGRNEDIVAALKAPSPSPLIVQLGGLRNDNSSGASGRRLTIVKSGILRYSASCRIPSPLQPKAWTRGTIGQSLDTVSSGRVTLEKSLTDRHTLLFCLPKRLAGSFQQRLK